MALCIKHSQAEPCPTCMRFFFKAGKELAGSKDGFQVHELNVDLPATMGAYIDSAKAGFDLGVSELEALATMLKANPKLPETPNLLGDGTDDPFGTKKRWK